MVAAPPGRGSRRVSHRRDRLLRLPARDGSESDPRKEGHLGSEAGPWQILGDGVQRWTPSPESWQAGSNVGPLPAERDHLDPTDDRPLRGPRVSRRQQRARVWLPKESGQAPRKPRLPNKPEGPATETRPIDLLPPTLVPLSEKQYRQAVSALAQLLVPLLLEDRWRERAA